MKNLFESEVRLYTLNESSDACQAGDLYLEALIGGAYRYADPVKLAAFLDDAVSKLDPNRNLLSLMPGESFPSDICMCLVYQPSYAVSVAAVYLKNTYPELISDETWSKLCEMTDTAYEHGIIGHGYDTEVLRDAVLTQLRLAGVQKFIEKYGAEFKYLTETVNSHIELHYNLAELVAGDDFPEGMMRYFSHSWEHNGCANVYIRCEAAIWKGYDRRIFVYGTLMKDQPAAHLLEDAIYIGKFDLEGYAMKSLGAFPGICQQKGEHVFGEVYCVTEEMLKKLDRYESEGSLYHRRKVLLSSYYGNTSAEAYVYAHEMNGEVIRRRWNSEANGRVWYAAYGSNLQAERFRCYVEGGTCKANGKTYHGCRDTRLWTDTYTDWFKGRMYFGNSSPSWGQKGVAFYAPNQQGDTIMRLYNISYDQLLDIREQECNHANWYGNMVYLGLGKEGLPIYTLTAEDLRPQNDPDEKYIDLITNALKNECKMKKRDADRYVKHCQKDKLVSEPALPF